MNNRIMCIFLYFLYCSYIEQAQNLQAGIDLCPFDYKKEIITEEFY
jgi:hypothetical protein